MSKALAILVVVLATQVSSCQHVSNVKQDGKGDQQSPAHSTTACDPNKPAKEQIAACQTSIDDSEHRVKLTDIPPISLAKIQKDWIDHVFDWGPWVFNLLLVIVGAIGGWFAWKTLNSIKQQTTQLAQQVRASHDGLRAWLGVSVRESDYKIVPPKFVWAITNYGQTPAFIKSVAVSNVAYGSLMEPLANFGKPLSLNGFLGAGATETHNLTLPDDAFRSCELGLMFWRVAVKVGYKDAFNRAHETMVSYHYYVPKTLTDPLRKGFYQDVNPATNYNT